MSFIETSKIDKNINSDNYLINCYENLIKIKAVHFLFILIEILLNILQELEVFIRGFTAENITKENTGLNFFSLLTNIFDKLPTYGKLAIIIFYMSIIELLYYLIKIRKFKINHIYIKIAVNFLEIFFFRTFTLIFLNFFFYTRKRIFFVRMLVFVSLYNINNK